MGLRVGIAGYGLAGSVFHAPLVEAASGLDVAAVMTRSEERAAQARAAHPAARVVESLDALLTDIDVLVVATPNSSHAEVAARGLQRGLHVVVDKPMAATAEAARGIADAGPERVTVFHNRRWDGDFLTVRRLVADGVLGQVTRFESRFERFRPQVKHGWREEPGRDIGGGVLLDLGPHLVDQALQLFGPPASVHGEVRTLRSNAVVDDDAFIAIEHASGVVSHLWMSAIAPLNGPRFRVSGLQAGFACDGLDPQEAQLRDGDRPSRSDFGIGGTGWLGADGEGEQIPLERGDYVAFYEGVRDWARGEAPPPVDPGDGVRVLELLEEVAA